MSEHKLSQIRSAFIETLSVMFPDSDSLHEAAEALGLSFEAARQARDYGKGSVETLLGLILFGLKITPHSLQKNLPKILSMFEKSGELTTLEHLIQEVINKYGRNELIAWLRLLNARHEIEVDLGIRKKAGRPKKSESSNQ